MIIKGKGNIKGNTKGDPKGIGKGKGVCYKCGHAGHIARDCPDPRPFQGNCTICGHWGHTAKFCQAGGVDRIGHEHDEPDAEADMTRSVNEFGIGGCTWAATWTRWRPGGIRSIGAARRSNAFAWGAYATSIRTQGETPAPIGLAMHMNG